MRKAFRPWLVWASCLAMFAALVMQPRASGAMRSSVDKLAQNTSQPGDSVRTITVDGLQRTYRLHIPPAYDGVTPLPLVFVLHGAGGDGKHMEQLTGFSAKANAEKLIVVYPNGTGNPQMWGIGFSPHPYSTVDDVSFIRALLNKLEHDLKIDANRVYSCGFSMGAMLTYRLAAEMPHRFAAVGIVSGSIGARWPDGTNYMIPHPTVPISVIAFHGKQDQTAGYDGGGTYDGHPTYLISVADSIALWVNVDGCAAPPQEVTKQNGNLVIDDYKQCHGTKEVVLYSFQNGTHEWPLATNNDHFNATDAIWEFFANHPKS